MHPHQATSKRAHEHLRSAPKILNERGNLSLKTKCACAPWKYLPLSTMAAEKLGGKKPKLLPATS